MTTLLTNALVYDGTQAQPQIANVLIDGNRIAYFGQDKPAADTQIDCTGLSLAPGFIDAHSHNDFFYDYPDAQAYYEPFVRQGITTQITGNCGFSPFGVPEDSPYKAEVGAGLFEAKNPGSFKDFVDRAKGNLFLNIVPLIGHGTARIGVNGRGSGTLSPEQKAKMLEAVDEAMRNGAFGGSFGFMYEPGMYSPKDELYAFASKVAEYDGTVTVHPRACSKVSMDYPLLSKPHIEIALDEVIDIMQKTGCKMEYSHLIFVGESSWKSLDKMLDKFHSYNKKGFKIAYDNYSFEYGASVITVICPSWYMALSPEQKHSALNKFKLRLMINMSRVLLGITFQDLVVAYINEDPKYKKYEGRNIQEIAKTEKRDCLDLYLELVDASKGAGKLYLGKYYNEAIIKRLMEDELSVFMTDAWVEKLGVQNGSAFQCYPNFLLKAIKYGIPMEKVINKMTAKTAERFGIKERGLIKEGYIADLTLFDPAKLEIFPSEPGKSAQGIEKVFIGGTCVLDGNTYTGTTCGEMILKS